MDFDFLNNSYPIEIKKKYNRLLRKVQTESKPEYCILCGSRATSFCNSHSVPRLVLKKIANEGVLLQSNSLFGLDLVDVEKGVNNSGTFHIICKECDNKFFRDYEDLDKLKSTPDDIMLAEIALKDALLQYSKRIIEIKAYQELQQKQSMFENPEALFQIQELDIRDYKEEIQFYKNIIEKKINNGFQILYWNKLPYKTPIAVQSAIALPKDYDGYSVNDNFDMSEDTRMEDMHICVFPMDSETIVLAFYHKRDTKYRKLRHQLNSISDKKKIEYLNWVIIQYTENYYLSKTILNVLNNEKLQELSKDNNDFPNMGFVSLDTIIEGYDPICKEEIPILLDEKYAIKE